MKESTTSMLRWSCEAEQAVLGALLTEPRAWKRAGDSLIPGQFYDPRHGAIFTVIAALANAGQAVDVVSVFERMQAEGKAETCGGIVYLNELAQSSVGAGNVVRHAEIVREKSAQRDLAAAIADAAEIVAGNDSVGTKLDNIAALLAPLERKQTRQAPRRIAEIAAERTVYYQQLAEGTA
ncbi:MAG: hypothetical protein IIZ92_03405, partial [Aquincola sp.]|nr:hypothetical protein [Aquincola sp.]